MSSSFQTCAINSISCFNLEFLHPLYRHFIRDLWSDQSLARFQVCVRNGQIELFIFIFNFMFWLLFCFGFCVGRFGLQFIHNSNFTWVVLSQGIAKWASAKLNNTVHFFYQRFLILHQFAFHIQIIQHLNFTWLFCLRVWQNGLGQAEQHCTVCVHISSFL
jgi:hypothetical protein